MAKPKIRSRRAESLRPACCWFRQLVRATARRPTPEQFIFLNAWNEWAEGTYLEPAERYGTGYLDAVKRCNPVKIAAD